MGRHVTTSLTVDVLHDQRQLPVYFKLPLCLRKVPAYFEMRRCLLRIADTCVCDLSIPQIQLSQLRQLPEMFQSGISNSRGSQVHAFSCGSPLRCTSPASEMSVPARPNISS